MTEPNTIPLQAQWEGDNLVITWDSAHPLALELGINNWSEQQWLDALLSHSRQVLADRPEP